MKILFINPSLRPGSDFLFLPVGLGYIMTYLKKEGYKFDLLDIDADQHSDEYVENYFKENKYDVIALGSIVTHYKWIKWCINTIKKHQPETKVILGNSVGGSIPEVVFQTTKVDIVIYGEAEVTITEVCNALRDAKSFGEINEPHVEIPHSNKGYPSTIKGEGIKGIIYRTQNGLIVNNGKRKAVKNIDDFPFPDWEMFDVQKYLNVGMKHGASHSWFYKAEEAIPMPVNTARGCVFKCTFCHYVFWHDPYRHRSAENVIAEIKQLKEKYGANFFNFWDELSFHKIGPAEKFLDQLIEADLKVHWTCAIRADLMGKDVDAKGNPIPRERRLNLAKKFVQAGCVSAGYSLESGNDKILETMNKKVKSEYFHEQVKICREAGLITNTSLVIGYPEETKATIDETMSKLEKLKVYPSAGFLMPLPETGMWDHAIKNGYITDIDQFLTDISERQDFSLNMTSIEEEELKAHTLKWLEKLNSQFGNLAKDKLIKTGGYDKHSKHQEKEKVDKNMTTKDSLNYAAQEGTLR
ncbi:B12-binding domain-containing radical SAM protein [Candidatus Pelagibacter sp.]|nr:B12-binding domain-containing radical SAM protein [Candidatus Pelagibacter sp.]